MFYFAEALSLETTTFSSMGKILIKKSLRWICVILGIIFVSTSIGLNCSLKKYAERPYFSFYPVFPVAEEDIQLGCEYLGIKKLTRIEKLEKKLVNGRDSKNSTFYHGHFPYELCPHTSKRTAPQNIARIYPNLAFVTVMSMNYIETLPNWAKQVKSLGAACAVVAIERQVCEEVSKISCECVEQYVKKQRKQSNEGPHASGWYQNRVLSIQKRFDGALHMLNRGFDVVMHDSDVFFKSDGMQLLVEYIYSTVENSGSFDYDFLVQDNGKRDTAYDRLNWGFVWMNNTLNAKSTLSCVLERWNDEAFGCKNCKDSYYDRSQPRINHILEESIYAPGNDGVSVCKLPALSFFNAIHMTGYPSVSKKITCARAAGFLLDDVSVQKGVSYDVPNSVNIHDQRKALQTAAFIATRLSLKLEIPNVFFEGKHIQICEIFDVKSLSSILMKSQSLNHCISITNSKFMNSISISTMANSNEWNSGNGHICLNFSWLLNTHSYIPSNEVEMLAIPICDPRNPAYRSIHSCKRDDNTDEI